MFQGANAVLPIQVPQVFLGRMRPSYRPARLAVCDHLLDLFAVRQIVIQVGRQALRHAQDAVGHACRGSDECRRAVVIPVHTKNPRAGAGLWTDPFKRVGNVPFLLNGAN